MALLCALSRTPHADVHALAVIRGSGQRASVHGAHSLGILRPNTHITGSTGKQPSKGEKPLDYKGGRQTFSTL